jgi:hypothetical protein
VASALHSSLAPNSASVVPSHATASHHCSCCGISACGCCPPLPMPLLLLLLLLWCPCRRCRSLPPLLPAAAAAATRVCCCAVAAHQHAPSPLLRGVATCAALCLHLVPRRSPHPRIPCPALRYGTMPLPALLRGHRALCCVHAAHVLPRRCWRAGHHCASCATPRAAAPCLCCWWTCVADACCCAGCRAWPRYAPGPVSLPRFRKYHVPTVTTSWHRVGLLEI